MKIRILIIKLLFFVVGAAMPLAAQTLRSSYFLEGATLRHQLNPAFFGQRNYISIPMLGNVNIGTSGNVGLSNFLYTIDEPSGMYDLTTFMNSSVGREEFLEKLKSNNRINNHLGLTIFSAGFYSWGGFNTFELNLKSKTSINLPYELFDFLKTGMDKKEYHIKNFAANSNNYIELVLGHAHKINDRLSLGAKVKFLVGAANVDAKIDRMDISLTENKWEVMANGTINTAVGGGVYKTKIESPGEINGFDVDNPGIGGYGAGLDLGATYQIGDNLILSASVLDLGFISWKNNLLGVTRNDKPFVFDGFTNIAVKPNMDVSNDFETQFDKIKDDLKNMSRFYDEGKVNRTTMLASSIYVGAEYFFPFYNKLSTGLIYSSYINRPYTWYEALISVNVRPLSWVDLSVNYSVSTFGPSLGWILNLHPKGITFFIGSDRMITKVTPQYMPVNNLNTNICLGFNVAFGRKR